MHASHIFCHGFLYNISHSLKQFLFFAQDDIVALRKAHTYCAPSISSLKAILRAVPILVWLNTDHYHPRKMGHQPHPFSTPISFMRSML